LALEQDIQAFLLHGRMKAADDDHAAIRRALAMS
jgi:hypothetical protein